MPPHGKLAMSELPSASPQERWDVEVAVVVVAEDGLGQAGAKRADANRTLLAFRRTVTIAIFDG
jgi:hypothetical protein